MNYRKLTPSMSLLLAFEASARHQSFTRAAHELSLTQSAISRQVQALEGALGVSLFHRKNKLIVPNDIGLAYMTEIAKALTLIRNATLDAITSQAITSRLRVATLPTFGAKWLLPRLNNFYETHAGLQIDLLSKVTPVDFSGMDLDAAIVVGEGNWPGVTAHRLYPEQLVLVCSGSTFAKFPRAQRNPRAKEDPQFNRPTINLLSGLVLLQVRSFPSAWQEWCTSFELPPEALRLGPSFELTSHLIQAVMAGIGVGLVPRMLVEDELRDAQLISPFSPVASSRAYYLVYPNRVRTSMVLVAFRDWLLHQVSTDRGTQPAR